MVKRLRDSIEKHMGQRGFLWCSFVPKRSKIGQEMAELWPFSHWEVVWFHWEAHGTKWDPLVFICTKKIQNWSRNSWIRGISPWEIVRVHWEAHHCIIHHCIMHNCILHHCKSFLQGVKGCVTHELQSSEVEASKNRIDQKIKINKCLRLIAALTSPSPWLTSLSEILL